MGDAEAVAQQLGELAPVGLGVAAGAHRHVGRDRGEARGDLPDVQVVHLDHVVLRGERAADLVRVEVARGGLEQDPAGVAQQPVARAEHQRGHHQRGDAVRAREAGEQDHGAGDRRGDEGEQVGEHVLEGALDVEAAAVGAGEDQRGGQVHGDAQRARRPARRAPSTSGGSTSRRIPSTTMTHGQRHQRGAVHLGGEDLGAPEAEREAAAGRAPREPGGEQRERDRAGVGEHVGGVGEQRERGGQDARHHLQRP